MNINMNMKKSIKNRFFCCYQGRRAKLFAFLSLLLLLSLLQLSCDVEENCLDPSTNCFLGAGSIKLVKSTPDASAGVNDNFNKVTLTFSEELSNISNVEDKDAYSFTGDGAANFRVKAVKKIDDTTVEIQFEGDIAEGPIVLDLSKLKDSDKNPLGTTSISFTNNFKAVVNLKTSGGDLNNISRKVVTVTPTGGSSSNATTITAPLGVTIAKGAIPGTGNAAGTGTVRLVIESSVGVTTRVTTATVGRATVTYPAGTDTNVNGSTGTGTGTGTLTVPAVSASIPNSYGTFTTPAAGGTITIITTGGTITTTGGTITFTTGNFTYTPTTGPAINFTISGTITTKYAKLVWGTNLKSANYHMGRGNRCPLDDTVPSNRTELGTRFQEGFPPGGSTTSIKNKNVSSEQKDTARNPVTIPTPAAANEEITTTISARNLLDGTRDGPSINELIICVEKKPGEYAASKTFSLRRHGIRE